MKATSADILEYESLRSLLGRYVSSPLGKAELAKIAPHTDAGLLAGELADAGEAVAYLRAAAQPQPGARGAAIRIEFGGIPDLTEAVHKLRIEGQGDPRPV
jgi:DNA mismatch repair protein MutS2